MRAAAALLALVVVLAAAPPSAQAEAPRGRRLALVVGTSSYRSPDWVGLTNAAPDAQQLAKVLEERYGFATTLLIDGDRDDLKRALSRAAESAGEDDDLLVFVAGHGYFDTTDKAGYLVLADGVRACDSGCYPLDNVRRALYGTRARHVLVMIDACYAGTFDLSVAFGTNTVQRGQPAAMRQLLRDYDSTRSRLILASVGKAPTLDGTPGLAHSPFVRVLLAELGRSDPDGVISVDHLALRLREGPEALPVIAPTVFPSALPHDVNGTFLFIAEGDFCAALEGLATQVRNGAIFAPQGTAKTPIAWGASHAIESRLPGAEACFAQRFDTDGAQVVRCRFGSWREDELADKRRALDKRLGLCAFDTIEARTAAACSDDTCVLSVVVK